MSVTKAFEMRIASMVCGACFAFVGISYAAQPAAQRYPAKAVRFVVMGAPSGTVDIIARMVGEKLSDAMGQQVVVDNRAGASGIMGTDLVAKAPADGYTILMTMTSHTTTPSMYSKLPYDPIKDFVPVSMVSSAALILVVNPSLQAHTVKDLIALGKAKPLNFGSAAVGSGGHLAGELFKFMTELKMEHVAYRGTGPAIIALMGNEVHFMFAGLLPVQSQIKSNRLRAIAVTSAKRNASMPELPTVSESGLPGFDVIGWYGVLAPAGTPAAVVNRLHAEIVKIVALPEIRERIAGQGADVVGSSPAEFAAFLKADIARWAPVIKKAGVRAD